MEQSCLYVLAVGYEGKMITKFLGRMKHKYMMLISPSYRVGYVVGDSFLKGIVRGIESEEPFTGFSSEQIEMLHNSAGLVTLFDDEDEKET